MTTKWLRYDYRMTTKKLLNGQIMTKMITKMNIKILLKDTEMTTKWLEQHKIEKWLGKDFKMATKWLWITKKNYKLTKKWLRMTMKCPQNDYKISMI